MMEVWEKSFSVEDFRCDICIVGSEFGTNNMKPLIHPGCISGSDWWCNDVGHFFVLLAT